RLKLLPLFKIYYPGQTLGQLYIPAVNFALWVTTSFFVLYFKTSEHMEAAYSLAITITMLMTTTLLTYFLIQKGTPKIAIAFISIGLFCIEGSFFAASLVQFINGAYIV
ncbi:potassium transporter Kup, partial [Streptococcus thermophilus]|nr:potassium transporter Kup [Streptococcus thermophilus]